MTKISTSQFQKGIFIEFRSQIHQIIDFQHVNPGKGAAFIRSKLRNIKTGNTAEFTYKSGEKVEQVAVYTREMQYLYQSEDKFYFMDTDSFDQIALTKSFIGFFADYLKEGDHYQVYVRENQGLGLKIPKKVKLKVIEAEEGVKGNTVTGAKKFVTVETGLQISVPLFIKKDDFIAIDPESGQYLERVNQ